MANKDLLLELIDAPSEIIARQALERGIPIQNGSKPRSKNDLIVAIIWHDGYFAGKLSEEKIQSSLDTPCEKEKPTVKYLISFAEDDGSSKVLRMSLEQERLLDFLANEYALDEYLSIRQFEEYEVIDI